MQTLIETISSIGVDRYVGRVAGVRGQSLEADGPPQALVLGGRATAHVASGDVRCEIVGFRGERAVLSPFDPMEGVFPGAKLTFDPRPFSIAPSDAWLGRVLDCFGVPVDGGGDVVPGSVTRPVVCQPPAARLRGRVGARLDLKIRALNTFTPACRGQRMGLFAGSGVGKSVLMGMLAQHADADVIVIGLVGERGREVREFVDDTLGPEGLARSVVIAATSDETPTRRRQAAWSAFAVAEHFRDQGKHVLLLVDSITRFAMAQREIGLAAGEPPTTKGYTPSVFAQLPRLLERAGPGVERGDGHDTGAITGLFTVLVDGGDMDEPVADAVRGILDGHIVMERAIAERGRYPAINVLKSVSRSMPECCSEDEWALVRKARGLMASYEDMAELIRIGAYAKGSNPDVDAAIDVNPALEAFLSQTKTDTTSLEDGFAQLGDVLKGV